MELEFYDLFHKWVPLYLRLPVLFLLFFAVLSANGVYVGNSNETANDLGVYPESFSEAYNAIYIGMGLGLIFHIRLKVRFTSKQLLLFGLSMQLLMNIVCATTSNTPFFIASCLILGFAKISALVEVYVIWLFIWSKKFDTTKVYPFVYFTALWGINFVNWFLSMLAYNYNWRYAYIAIIILLLLCLLCAITLIENHPLKKKIPLYQVDLLGLSLLAISMVLLNYAVVNGRVEDWLSSKAIILALFLSLISLLLFIKRQLALKRPLLDLTLFKTATFREGLFYVFILGIFLPGNFQAVFAGGILKYNAPTNMELSLYLLPGILIGCGLCYFWYYYKLDASILIIGGFSAFVIYHIIMYYSFSVTFTKNDFILPTTFKGFGITLMYIAAGLLTTKNLSLDKVVSASGVMILVRSFIGSGFFTGLYSYLLYTQRIRHADYLATGIDSNSLFVRAAGKTLYQNIQEQAILTASKEITGMIIIAGIFLLVCLLIRYFIKLIKGLLIA